MSEKPIASRVVLLAVIVLWAIAPAAAQEAAGEEPAPDDAAAATAAPVESRYREKLEEIREDLVQLRLEKALAAMDILLEDPGLGGNDRTEAWILRSQAHDSFGDLDAVEADYREILRQRPGFVPESSLTTPKAMERFKRTQTNMVGTLLVELKPRDAQLFVDGEERLLAGDNTLAVLAGERSLSARRRGYDPYDQVLDVTPGKVTELELLMIPNARTVIVRTNPESVTVTVDGNVMGETVQAGSSLQDAVLVIEDIPLGEHHFELSKPCFRTVKKVELLTVDIMDPTALDMPTVMMQPSRAKLDVVGEPAGATVLVDGERVGTIPLEGTAICPGVRVFEVDIRSRPVYLSDHLVQENETVRLDVRPRPNAVLVGAVEWPREFAEFAATVNTLATLPLPAGVELWNREGWSKVTLPDNTHLAVAVLPPVDEGAPSPWLMYSPRLQVVERLDVAPGSITAPRWESNELGLFLGDSRIGGPSLIVHVPDHGPAHTVGIRPGQRLVSINGEPAGTAAEARAVVAGTTPGSKVRLELINAAGSTTNVDVQGSPSPRIVPLGPRVTDVMIVAAWAEQEASAYPDRAATSLANLAALLTLAGRHDVAAETWRRIRWGERPGIGDGTAAYYLGRSLMTQGYEEEAVRWFRKAAESDATTFSDFGPRLAPAAADHLADLGIAE